MNSSYIGKLMELAEKDSNVIHLLADSGTGYDEMFRRNFPDQIYNFGIGEENMVAAAAGMATVGKIPFVFTAGAFLVYRAMEFIRNDVCFQNLNVKIVGMGSGLSWSSLGPTHHTTEEISVLRAIPGLRILSPATPLEVGACVQLAYDHVGPVYIRIGMNQEKEYFEEGHIVEFAQNVMIRYGEDVTIISTGSILCEALLAANMLESDGIKTGVINAVSIKPFDASNIIEISKRTRCLATVEEHNVIGGLGSIVADTLVDNGIFIPLIRIGLNDIFAKGYGSIETVREENELNGACIACSIKEKLK